MKKTILVATLFLLFNAGAAKAEHQFAWDCNINGQMDGYTVGFILGVQGMRGDGVISCRSNTNNEVREIPVRLDMFGAGITFELSRIRDVRVVAAGIGFDGDPNSLLSSFSIGPSAGASLIRHGLEVNAAIELSRAGGPNFELGFISEQVMGLGFHLHIHTFTISRR